MSTMSTIELKLSRASSAFLTELVEAGLFSGRFFGNLSHTWQRWSSVQQLYTEVTKRNDTQSASMLGM